MLETKMQHWPTHELARQIKPISTKKNRVHEQLSVNSKGTNFDLRFPSSHQPGSERYCFFVNSINSKSSNGQLSKFWRMTVTTNTFQKIHFPPLKNFSSLESPSQYQVSHVILYFLVLVGDTYLSQTPNIWLTYLHILHILSPHRRSKIHILHNI